MLTALLAISTVCTAQLNVDSQGRVIFGKQPYSTAISIVDETKSGSSHFYPLRITYKDNRMITFSRHTGSAPYGLMFTDRGGILMGDYPSSGRDSYTPLEVYGLDFAGGIKVFQPSSTAFNGISVNISSYASAATNFYEARKGANNNLLFNVDGNGVVYSNGNQLTSDVRLKSEIETISNPLDKVLQLRGVTFKMDFATADEKALSGEEIWQLMKKRTPEITPEIFRQIQEEKERHEMGVIAQEVEKVLPEVVRTREDGLKSVAYHEMIGLLIEAIKELKTEVDELKGGSAEFRSSTGISGLAQQCALSQNAPNPFSDLTEIKYFVASGVQEAYICVFDMQGKMLQKINVSAGQGSVTIQASTLQPGMYLYSLVADGQEADTKRMILTK